MMFLEGLLGSMGLQWINKASIEQNVVKVLNNEQCLAMDKSVHGRGLSRISKSSNSQGYRLPLTPKVWVPKKPGTVPGKPAESVGPVVPKQPDQDGWKEVDIGTKLKVEGRILTTGWSN